MTLLYIANCTLRTWEFLYRLPEREQVFTRVIPAGAQICLFERGETSQIVEYVIEQHERYGVFKESDVKGAKSKISGIFGIDKQVSPGTIMLANEITHKIATNEAYEMRRRAAIGSHNSLLNSIPDSLELGSFTSEVEDRSDKSKAKIVSSFEVARGTNDPAPRRRKAA